ncbi:hypothetical protein [Yersinia similis]|nr:hypothetical protein [Yersinia similis]
MEQLAQLPPLWAQGQGDALLAPVQQLLNRYTLLVASPGAQ